MAEKTYDVSAIRRRMRTIADGTTAEYAPIRREFSEMEHIEAQAERNRIIRETRAQKWDEKVPRMWSQWGFSSLPDSYKGALDEWLKTKFPDGKNLILYGPTGSGKTAMAYAVARELYLNGLKVKIWEVADLLGVLRPSYENKDSVSRSDTVLEQVKKADVLVLDDLGAEKRTEKTDELIYTIVNHRWEWKLPIIVTTNFQELSECVSDRVASRLQHDAEELILNVSDHRRS